MVTDGSAFAGNVFAQQVKDVPDFTRRSGRHCRLGRQAGVPFSPCEAMDAIHGQCYRSSCGGSRHFPSPSSELKWIFKQLHLTLPFLLFFFSFLFYFSLEQTKERSPALLSWLGSPGSASSNRVMAKSRAGSNVYQEMCWQSGPCTAASSLQKKRGLLDCEFC